MQSIRMIVKFPPNTNHRDCEKLAEVFLNKEIEAGWRIVNIRVSDSDMKEVYLVKDEK